MRDLRLMRLVRLIPIVALLMAGACDEIKDLFTLSAAIHKQYDASATVKLTNRTHLLITLDNAPDGSPSDSVGRAQLAREVATFAKVHYAHSAQLQDITIAFANVKNIGPVTITRSDVPFSFRMADLR